MVMESLFINLVLFLLWFMKTWDLFSIFNLKPLKIVDGVCKYLVKPINREFTFILNTKALHLADEIEVVQQRTEAWINSRKRFSILILIKPFS